jgi:hypothetical protein
MIDFNANWARCWIEREQIDELRAGNRMILPQYVWDLFIQFEGSIQTILNTMGVSDISEWLNEDITARNGADSVIGRVVSVDPIITEHGYRYFDRFLGYVEVPTKYEITYRIAIKNMIRKGVAE